MPVSIITVKCSTYLFENLARFSNSQQFKIHQETFVPQWFNQHLRTYVNSISNGINTSIGTNWFARSELELCIELLKSITIQNMIGKYILLNLTYNIITCLGDYQINDILFLLNNVIFNIDYYLHKIIFRRTDINNWNTLYVKIFMQKYLTQSNLVRILSDRMMDGRLCLIAVI